jgi:starvation-inducible outer membrane lipoprotein
MNVKTGFVIALTALAIGLSACASGPKGVRITNDGTSATSAKPGEKIRALSASEIRDRIVGKTFQYTRSDGNGFVEYFADGTMSITDDTKGTTKGRWSASGEQYCETFGANAIQECGIFKTTGDAYFAANSRLVEMQV